MPGASGTEIMVKKVRRIISRYTSDVRGEKTIDERGRRKKSNRRKMKRRKMELRKMERRKVERRSQERTRLKSMTIRT